MRPEHKLKSQNDRLLRLRRQLEFALDPTELELKDDSAQHIGHAHAGRGHYSVRIVSPAFARLTLLQRHRMIYAALGVKLQNDIHALSITALAPGEIR